jgi:hypothetical protein
MSDKWKEDKADPQVNVDLLNSEFDIEISSNLDKTVQEVKEMRKELKELESDLPDADQIIYDNIERANRILDTIEFDISNGDHSARLLEVVGQLINAVTSAATSITGISYNQQLIDHKNRMLDIKEKELAVKGIVKGAENVNITNNNLVMTREDLLKMLDE